MKRRITFIHEKEDAIDPKKYNVTGQSIHIQGLKAIREDRWTASLYELPQEVRLFVVDLVEPSVDEHRYGGL